MLVLVLICNSFIDKEITYFEILNLTTFTWRRQNSFGEIPELCTASYHAVSGNTLFLYGGGAMSIEAFTDKLYTLDLDTFKWQLLNSTGPSAKALGGMVSFGHRLVAFGGVGSEIGVSVNKGAEFISSEHFGQFGHGWNNAIHEYHVNECESLGNCVLVTAFKILL